MPKKSHLKFEQVKTPINECVSKFGGQPNWVQEPEWPLDRETNTKMQFVGQIELTEELFGETLGKMAYIFFAFDPDLDGNWDPNSGLNAVIVQPGDNKLNTVADRTGPASNINKHVQGIELDEYGLAEFKLKFDLTNEPDYLNDEMISRLIDTDEEAYNVYANKMEVSKIGGNPFFIQSEEIPLETPWKFLCQLDESYVPVWVNFGTGVAYAFIDEAGTSGKILWQC